MRVIAHWVVFAFIATILTLTMQFLGNPLLTFSEQLAAVWKNQGIFAIVIFMLMPLFIYDTVRLSHRFAGPIVRLRRALNDVAEGKKPVKIKFRDGDFWKDLADEYNILVEKGFLTEVPREQSTPVEQQEEPTAAAI